MRGGDLRYLVTIQQRVDGQDEVGQPVQTWADVAQVWADIRYLTGLETIRADAQSGVTRVSIRIRFRTDVTAGMRIVYGATVYEVKPVLPDYVSRQYMDLPCEVIS